METITLFVHPDSLIELIRILKILSVLPIDNEYKFPYDELFFSILKQPGYLRFNIHVDDYLKLDYAIKNYI